MADTPSRAGVAGTYLQTVAYSYGASQGQGSAWFGPSAPMRPTAPPDVIGRQFDYPVGFNLDTRPRAYQPIGFRDLRALADGYDLLRLAIETRKDQISRMSWAVQNRDQKKKDAGDPRVKALTAFFRRPDGTHGWADWLRPILEDLFVIDAPALYMQRDRGGRLIELVQIDGATIKPVIDDWGRTPRPYSDGSALVYPAAYQQILKNLPAVNYATRDLLYRPRNRRIHTPYGFSPVEQITTTVNIALRRQLSTLSYFTEGNIPDMMVQVPPTWTPDQIVAYQTHWDSYFSGDVGRRRRAKFVPGGTGAGGIHETRQADLKGDFDEWLAKLICFAFSISPQALTRQMNRASADTQKELAEEEGLEPILLWFKALVDDILAFEFNAPDLEFVWNDDDEVNAAQQMTTLGGYVSKGILTINEARQELGRDPLDDPEASRAMIITGSGAVPLGSFQQQQDQSAVTAKLMADAQAKQPAPAIGADGKPVPQMAAPKPGDDANVVKSNAYHDRRGRFASAEDSSSALSAADWQKAKESALSVAKGVALVSVAAIGAALLPETLAVAGGVAAGEAAAVAGASASEAVTAATAEGSSAWVTHTVNGVATGMFTNAGFKSATVILQHAGFDTKAIEAKVKPLTDFFKVSGPGSDTQFSEALCDVADHARDELISHVASRYAGHEHLQTALAAITASCANYKAAIDRIYKTATPGFTKRGPLRWRRPDPIPFDRPATALAEAAISNRIGRVLAGLGSKFAAALRVTTTRMAKSDPDDIDRAMLRAEEIINDFDLSDLQEQAGDIGDDLQDVVRDAVSRAVAQIGPDDADGLTDQVNERAVKIAQERAAELVGMHYDADGSLVPSADAEMAITDSTRAMLRQSITDALAAGETQDEIAADIEKAYAFSPERAEVIAATEVSRANSMASLESYQAAADAGVPVRKAWLAEKDCCDVCSGNAAAGSIDLNDAFPSGDDTPPGHPHCRCSLTPVVGDVENGKSWPGEGLEKANPYHDGKGRFTTSSGGGRHVATAVDFKKQGVALDRGSMSVRQATDVYNSYFRKPPAELKSSLLRDTPGISAEKSTIAVSTASPGSVRLDVSMRNQDGRQMATMGRIFRPDPENGTTVYHESFYVDQDAQGAGLAKAVLANSMSEYQAMSVSRVSLVAGDEVGGYAWARYGFVPKSEAAWKALVPEIRDRLNDDKLQISDARRSQINDLLDSTDPSTIRKISDLRTSVGGKKLGQALLLGTMWNGSLSLKDSTAMGRFKRYVRR